MLDSVRTVGTPEGATLTLRLAGPVSRARAWLIDFLIRMAIMAAASQALYLLGAFGSGVVMLLAFLLEWLYPVVFEVLWQGATPGKRMFRLMVLHDDGTPVGLGASFSRNTLRAIDFLPFLYGVGVTTMLMGNGFKRLGDLLAGTVVVYREDASVLPALPADARAEPPPFALQIEEQRAVIEFVRRAPALTPERAAELAALTGRFSGKTEAGDAREALLRIGYFLLGRR